MSNISDQERSLINQALQTCGQRPMPTDHLDALAAEFGIPELVRLSRAAIAGQECDRLFHLVRVARAHAAARTQLRMPYATIERLDVARTLDPERFGSVFSDAIGGDVNAAAVIKGWLVPPATPAHGNTDEPPIHATTLAPPQPSQRIARDPHAAVPVGRAQTPPPTDNVRTLQQPAPVPVHPTSDSEPTRNYDQVVVYGRDKAGGTALQVENSPTRDRKSTTINLSLARAKGQKTQDGVAWDRKLMIMLEPHEVQLYLSVLLGKLPSARFAGHGSANDKWMEVTESVDPQWAGVVNVTIAQGKGNTADIRRCGISATDIGEVIAIFNRALLNQLPGTAPVPGHVIAARVADLYTKARAASQMRESTPRQAAGAGR